MYSRSYKGQSMMLSDCRFTTAIYLSFNFASISIFRRSATATRRKKALFYLAHRYRTATTPYKGPNQSRRRYCRFSCSLRLITTNSGGLTTAVLLNTYFFATKT